MKQNINSTGAPVVRFTREEIEKTAPSMLAQIRGWIGEADGWPELAADDVRLLFQLADSCLSLCDVIWPGREPWKPTAEHPQQDFYEGVVESFRLQHQIDEKEIMALRRRSACAAPFCPSLANPDITAAIPTIPASCVGRKRAGRTLDGRTWDEVPSV